MKGARSFAVSPDGVRLGLLSAGSDAGGARPLLLVHGGMGQIERWEPIWDALVAHRRTIAMDRRGRGSSGDSATYSAERESADIAAVISHLSTQSERPVDVFAHSIGASYTIGAISGSPDVGRLVLYEPPGPETVSGGWADRVTELIERGQIGRAVSDFLHEIIGLTSEQIAELRDAPSSYDVLTVAARTLPREAHALENLDLADAVKVMKPTMEPTLLLTGSLSPPWAQHITTRLGATMPNAEVVQLLGVGHEAIDQSPTQLTDLIEHFLDH